MKGIILSAGYGTRLRPFTHAEPKQMLRVANKPVSQYMLENLRSAGVKDIAIVVGSSHPEMIQDYYKRGRDFGVNIKYVYQDAPRGISDAIGLCRDFVGDERFVACLGDNMLQKGLTPHVRRFAKSRLDAMVMLRRVDNPGRFGVAEKTGAKITRIVEKPRKPKSNLAVIGVYFLTPSIFDVIDGLEPSRRGELEITDALDVMLRNYRVGSAAVTGWWKDVGTPNDLLHANDLVLDSIGTKDQLVQGKAKNGVIVGEGSSVSDSVTGPAIVGRNCQIGPNATIGPYVSVGDDCKIQDCYMYDSIVMDGCRIKVNVDISDSIFARKSRVTGSHTTLRHRFILGGDSYVKM